MIVQRTSIFPADREAVFQKLRRLETLQYIAWPYASFEPVDGAAGGWSAGTTSSYRFRLFGRIPFGTHTIHIVRFDREGVSSREGERTRSRLEPRDPAPAAGRGPHGIYRPRGDSGRVEDRFRLAVGQGVLRAPAAKMDPAVEVGRRMTAALPTPSLAYGERERDPEGLRAVRTQTIRGR